MGYSDLSSNSGEIIQCHPKYLHIKGKPQKHSLYNSLEQIQVTMESVDRKFIKAKDFDKSYQSKSHQSKSHQSKSHQNRDKKNKKDNKKDNNHNKDKKLCKCKDEKNCECKDEKSKSCEKSNSCKCIETPRLPTAKICPSPKCKKISIHIPDFEYEISEPCKTRWLFQKECEEQDSEIYMSN